MNAFPCHACENPVTVSDRAPPRSFPEIDMALMKQNWVLVDYENVQAVELDLISGLPVQVILFVGPHQKSLPVELFKKGLAMKEKLTVIESAGSGKNALDFQMAFHAGRIAERHPDAFIHFVTKDTGFDVLVKHMKASKLLSDRALSFASLKFLSSKTASEDMSLQKRTAHAAERLGRQSPASRPRKRKTLVSSVSAMFGKQLDTPGVEAVLNALISEGKVIVGDNDGITYCLEAK